MLIIEFGQYMQHVVNHNIITFYSIDLSKAFFLSSFNTKLRKFVIQLLTFVREYGTRCLLSRCHVKKSKWSYCRRLAESFTTIVVNLESYCSKIQY